VVILVKIHSSNSSNDVAICVTIDDDVSSEMLQTDNTGYVYIVRCRAQGSQCILIEIYYSPPVESGSNTSTAAPRVVGGDEKGAQYLGI
jgi:hypothetical protein